MPVLALFASSEFPEDGTYLVGVFDFTPEGKKKLRRAKRVFNLCNPLSSKSLYTKHVFINDLSTASGGIGL